MSQMIRTRVNVFAGLLLTLSAVAGPGRPTVGCTTLLVGKRATADGSVLMASSCDGDVMGLISVVPARTYPPGTKLPMYWNVPRPQNYDEYRANVRKGYELVGQLPTEAIIGRMLLSGNVESMTTGGLNEHGVSIAIEFLPMRAGLACDKGVVGPNSNHWTTSLIANGLHRAKTAREAIQVIGSMIDEYGFLYYRAPAAGVALPIADENETWLMEIFGPGEDWTPESNKPGGVWCAQRIPDGEVGCSANRSRIGKVNLKDSDQFIASGNIFLSGRGTWVLEAGRAVPLVRRLWRAWERIQFAARMASPEPGSSVARLDGLGRSGGRSISLLGKTGQANHRWYAHVHHAGQLRRHSIRPDRRRRRMGFRLVCRS